MTRKYKLKELGQVLLLCTAGGGCTAFAHAGLLTLSANQMGGDSIQVITSFTSGGTAAAGLQWDMSYPASDLTAASETFYSTELAAGAAGKNVTCRVLTPGVVRCEASGLNANTVNSGVLAKLNFRLPPGSSAASFSFGVTDSLGSDSAGNGVAVDGAGTTVGSSWNSTGYRFVSVSPCRVADTRRPNGPFGGPELAANMSRSFEISSSACGLPPNAFAYAVNATVIPSGRLGALTLYPSGAAIANTSTLTSDGRQKSNAAIVAAGVGGGISVFATDRTQFVLDIIGYFIAADANSSALAYYPVTPCRVADTRSGSKFTGVFGPPSISGDETRSLPISSGSCKIPPNAEAYSLNITSIPINANLGSLEAWAGGTERPGTTVLSAPSGTITANAAIVAAGSGGDISLWASSATDVVVDIEGYFAPAAAGGLSYFASSPCRALDSRISSGVLSADATYSVNLSTGACKAPAMAKAYILNAMILPHAPVSYARLWATGSTRPAVSLIDSADGASMSNLAIVPSNLGSVSASVGGNSDLVLDLSGYFAP